MRRKKPKFTRTKMFASRVEASDFDKFEFLLKYRDHIALQDFVNLVVVQYISGNLALSGSQIVLGAGPSSVKMPEFAITGSI